jgi:hypothetical protein
VCVPVVDVRRRSMARQRAPALAAVVVVVAWLQLYIMLTHKYGEREREREREREKSGAYRCRVPPVSRGVASSSHALAQTSIETTTTTTH